MNPKTVAQSCRPGSRGLKTVHNYIAVKGLRSKLGGTDVYLLINYGLWRRRREVRQLEGIAERKVKRKKKICRLKKCLSLRNIFFRIILFIDVFGFRL